MARGVVHPEVGLDFYQPGLAPVRPYEQLADEGLGYVTGVAGEELAGKDVSAPLDRATRRQEATPPGRSPYGGASGPPGS